jgi:hypothetical protein
VHRNIERVASIEYGLNWKLRSEKRDEIDGTIVSTCIYTCMRDRTYPVDNEEFSVHVLAGIASKEYNGTSKVLGMTPAACRNAL